MSKEMEKIYKWKEKKRGGNGQGKGHFVMEDLSFSNTANISTITSRAMCPTIPLAPFLSTTPSIFFGSSPSVYSIKTPLLLYQSPLSSIFHTTGTASTNMPIPFICLQ